MMYVFSVESRRHTDNIMYTVIWILLFSLFRFRKIQATNVKLKISIEILALLDDTNRYDYPSSVKSRLILILYYTISWSSTLILTFRSLRIHHNSLRMVRFEIWWSWWSGLICTSMRPWSLINVEGPEIGRKYKQTKELIL